METEKKAKYKPPGGSRKGRPNKVTKELKDMIRGALDAGGGQKWLERQMTENPSAFMTLLGKILPKDINAELSGSVEHVVTKIERVIVEPKDSDS